MPSYRFPVRATQALFVLLMVATFPLSAEGAAFDLADDASWNIRWDGPLATDWLSDQNLFLSDVNGDGELDIVVATNLSDNQSRNGSGSIYLIYSDLFRSITGKGNTIDLGDSSNWNVRFDGPLGPSVLGFRPTAIGDVDGDDKVDLGLSARLAATNGSLSGAVFLIYGALLDGLTGTGNVLDLADSGNYNIRIDGAAPSDFFGNGRVLFADLDGDERLDLVSGASGADNNSRSGSGSAYVLYNTLLDDYPGTGNILKLASSTSYSLRFDGPVASTVFVDLGINSLDLDEDGRMELLLTDYSADLPGRSDAGSVWVIGEEVFDVHSGTGNNVDLASSTNYKVRINGGSATENLGISTGLVDIDNDGSDDLMVGAYHSDYQGTDSGSIYIIGKDILDSIMGSGNVLDLASSTSYTLRIDGSAGVGLPRFNVLSADFDSDGKDDIITGSFDDRNSRTNSGSAYIFPNGLFSAYDGTGDILALSSISTSSYTRFDGASSGDSLSEAAIVVGDLNGDNSPDLLVGSYLSDNNSRSDSGSFYLIYNYPHEITKDSVPDVQAGSGFDLTGTIEAVDSASLTAAIEYQVDSNSPDSGWTACVADDGAFDSADEDFTCSIPGVSGGNHIVYVRARDENGSLTPSSNYVEYSITAQNITADVEAPVISGYLAPQRDMRPDYPSPSVSSGTLWNRLSEIEIQLLDIQSRLELIDETGIPSAGSVGSFARDLFLGSSGEDVRMLQIYLNSHGFPVALEGPGSPGNETNFFGGLTKAALIKFQEARQEEILAPLGLVGGTGYFGQATRQYVGNH